MQEVVVRSASLAASRRRDGEQTKISERGIIYRGKIIVRVFFIRRGSIAARRKETRDRNQVKMRA